MTLIHQDDLCLITLQLRVQSGTTTSEILLLVHPVSVVDSDPMALPRTHS